jgi:heme/copper-type cytochrome/quinol oxidase subunit 1
VIAAAVALLSLIWAYFSIPDSLQGRMYYETLFWGSGHVLQFTHTLLMLVGWLWLASAGGIRVPLTPRAVAVIFCMGVAWVFLAPWLYVSQDVTSLGFSVGFTRLMAAGGGLAAVPLGLVVLWGLIAGKDATDEQGVYRTALTYSVGLFGVGGVLGLLIQGSNTLITAHYHGSNGAITVAFMGLCYLLLPRLGFGEPRTRLANIQLHAYAIGQFLHVLGLAWAGGYGMQRKIAGSGQTLENIQQTAGMALMGIGGLIAVIGGVLFLVVVLRAMWPGLRERRSPNLL